MTKRIQLLNVRLGFTTKSALAVAKARWKEEALRRAKIMEASMSDVDIDLVISFPKERIRIKCLRLDKE